MTFLKWSSFRSNGIQHTYSLSISLLELSFIRSELLFNFLCIYIEHFLIDSIRKRSICQHHRDIFTANWIFISEQCINSYTLLKIEKKSQKNFSKWATFFKLSIFVTAMKKYLSTAKIFDYSTKIFMMGTKWQKFGFNKTFHHGFRMLKTKL